MKYQKALGDPATKSGKRTKETTPKAIHQGVLSSLKYNQKVKQPNISKKAAKKNIPKLPIIYCPIFYFSFIVFRILIELKIASKATPTSAKIAT